MAEYRVTLVIHGGPRPHCHHVEVSSLQEAATIQRATRLSCLLHVRDPHNLVVTIEHFNGTTWEEVKDDDPSRASSGAGGLVPPDDHRGDPGHGPSVGPDLGAEGGEGRINEDKFEEIMARHQAATPGPWRWFGNTKTWNIFLATVDRGRIFVMGFKRWGMNYAEAIFQDREKHVMVSASEMANYERPYRNDFVGINHPDATALERSWEDIEWLISEVRRLRGEES